MSRTTPSRSLKRQRLHATKQVEKYAAAAAIADVVKAVAEFDVAVVEERRFPSLPSPFDSSPFYLFDGVRRLLERTTALFVYFTYPVRIQRGVRLVVPGVAK
jgi:hypothetical protein